MTRRMQAGMALLLVQLALVLSVGAKYLYERSTRPRVWVRTGSVDPNQPLRGRYLALQMLVDGCGLPRDEKHLQPIYPIVQNGKTIYSPPKRWDWPVRLEASDGKLVPKPEDDARSPAEAQRLSLLEGRACERMPVQPAVEYFLPDTARGPFPLKKDQELWVEVTVPADGPPRPVQLALSDAAGFHVLALR